jgi:hypothetical protein
MVYRHGVGVEQLRDAASENTPSVEGSGTGSAATVEQTDWKQRAGYYAPPLQVHTIVAGVAVSLALAALGVSLRAGAKGDQPGDYSIEVAPVQSNIASALNPSFARAKDPNEYEPDLDGPPPEPRIPRARPAGARFWLIAALLAIVTSLTGFWTLAYFSDVWNPKDLWDMIADRETAGGARRLAHVITGGGIIVLLLLLSVIARVTAGRRFVVLLFTMLLIVAVAAQTWFGSLLMFDSPSGTLGSFNAPAGAAVDESPTTGPTTAPAVPPAATTTTAPAK